MACVNAFARTTPYAVKKIDATEVIAGAWKNLAVAFAMPGGADRLYREKLDGKGNLAIREYVESGGTYFGFRAGAYYGSLFRDFHKGDLRGYEILEKRELAFFEGSAVGPTLAEYDYFSEAGARIAEIELTRANGIASRHRVYFNGGYHFQDAQNGKNLNIIGYYVNPERRIPEYGSAKLPAIIEIKVSEGRAILSGVHPEYDAKTREPHIPEAPISESDAAILKERILPALKDESRMAVFEELINRLEAPES